MGNWQMRTAPGKVHSWEFGIAREGGRVEKRVRMAVHPSELGEVCRVFEENFERHGELGASVSVWWDGRELLSLGDGWCDRERSVPWDTGTLVPVYSVTKVLTAATLLLAMERVGLGVEDRVSDVWPDFPEQNATFAQMLSHQCGLCALDRTADVFDHQAVVAALEAQQPAWPLGLEHGYHPRTYGAMVVECVQRITGRSLKAYWREEIAEPMGLDFWIGLPKSEHGRVARLYPKRMENGKPQSEFFREFIKQGSLTWRAFHSPRGLQTVASMNEPRTWEAGLGAMGGVGTASALAKFYQGLLGTVDGPLGGLPGHALATPQCRGMDRVLMQQTVFTCGAQMDPLDGAGRKLREVFGPSKLAYGHPGAGGSLAFCDPASGVSFAYVMNSMSHGVMPGERCLGMVRALFSGH